MAGAMARCLCTLPTPTRWLRRSRRTRTSLAIGEEEMGEDGEEGTRWVKMGRREMGEDGEEGTRWVKMGRREMGEDGEEGDG